MVFVNMCAWEQELRSPCIVGEKERRAQVKSMRRWGREWQHLRGDKSSGTQAYVPVPAENAASILRDGYKCFANVRCHQAMHAAVQDVRIQMMNGMRESILLEVHGLPDHMVEFNDNGSGTVNTRHLESRYLRPANYKTKAIKNYADMKCMFCDNDKGGPSFMLEVQKLSGNKFAILVSPSDTIQKVKAQIQDEQTIPSRQQNLLLDGILLSPDMTLSDYNIFRGAASTLTLLITEGLDYDNSGKSDVALFKLQPCQVDDFMCSACSLRIRVGSKQHSAQTESLPRQEACVDLGEAWGCFMGAFICMGWARVRRPM